MDAKLSLGELSALYLVRCEVEGKSAQTVRAYGETLGRFRRAVAVAMRRPSRRGTFTST